MKSYFVEFMGNDFKDMYDITIAAKDIDEAFVIANGKKDKDDDRIVSICEIFNN